MQSFKSRELVTELFAWRHYYWFLTDEGIEYLRVYLNLPSEIVPATLKKSTRPLEKDGGRPPRRDYGDRPPRREGGFGGDRRCLLRNLLRCTHTTVCLTAKRRKVIETLCCQDWNAKTWYLT